MTVFSVCYGMEKEPSLLDKFKELLVGKPQTKTSSNMSTSVSSVVMDDCPVCLLSYAASEFVQGNCGHSFCPKCIGQWLVGEKGKSRNSCPICRQNVIKASSVEDKIKINMLENQIISLNDKVNSLTNSKNDLEERIEVLSKVEIENKNILAFIHSGVAIRTIVPLFLGEQSPNNIIKKLIGLTLAQVLLINEAKIYPELCSQETRSKGFLTQLFLPVRLLHIGCWTAFFYSMSEAHWKPRLISSVILGTGFEVVDIAFAKYSDYKKSKANCNFVGLVGVGLGLGVNTFSNYLKLTGAIKDN